MDGIRWGGPVLFARNQELDVERSLELRNDIRLATWIGAFAVVAVTSVIVGGVALATNSPSSPKAQYQQRVDQERAIAVAAPKASKTARPPIIPPAPASERVEGISPVKQGPVPPSEFQVVNSWAGPVPGQGTTWYVVWAGSTGEMSSTPGVPGLILQSQSPTADGRDFVETTLGTFFDPKAGGPLQITAAAGAVVSMTSANGTTLRFNVLTRRFI